jgi:aminomuconate-semialdehyde/2-hydroxymuconate-6-semialdehyde dehydrogenase
MAPRQTEGFYFGPTIIEGAAPEDPINQQEIFGPVVTLAPFKDFNGAIKLANGSPYGLSATVWTKNLSTAHKAAHQLEVGVVWINSWMVRDLRAPFGGMKASGMGREGGEDALKFFTETKNIFAAFS